jgi:transposase
MRPLGTPEELERRRYRAVALLAERHSPVEVARIIGVDRRSVRRWKAAHRQQGVQALWTQLAACVRR